MIDMLSLITIGLAFFAVAVSPGPATISNATIAMSRGRKTSLIYGAGLSMGLLIWGIVAISGMGVVLQSSVYVMMTLKILGGLYLIWLAYQSFRNSSKLQADLPNCTLQETSSRKWFLRGFLLNCSNPKTVIAWMAALSVGMGSHDDMMSLLAALLTCMLVGFAVNALYSVVFSMGGVMKTYQRFAGWIDRLVSGVFALGGIGLIRSAFNRNPL